MSAADTKPSSSTSSIVDLFNIPLSKTSRSRTVSAGTNNRCTLAQSADANGHDFRSIFLRISSTSFRAITVPVIDNIWSPSAYRIIESGEKTFSLVAGSAFKAAAPNALDITTGSLSKVISSTDVAEGRKSLILLLRLSNCFFLLSSAIIGLAERFPISSVEFGFAFTVIRTTSPVHSLFNSS